MKKVLLIMAAILLANAVSAQNYEKNILGVRAGLNTRFRPEVRPSAPTRGPRSTSP